MNILNNINVLLAKLTEKQYAPYKELYESMKEEYDKRYDHIFGIGNNRLYLDDNVEIKAVDYSADLFSVDFVRFVTFLAILTKSHFEDLYLDILYNRIYSKDGREYKLTKFLQLLTEQKLKNVTKEEYDYILNEYDVKKIISYYISNLPPKSILNNDGKIKLIVVISRNPYDIAGMSTDRRWSSCMRLPDDGPSIHPSIHPGGAYYQHLIHDIELGTLVAYLIEPTDKNIEHPYARIAIKPYQNIKDKSIVLYAENRVYNDASLDDNIYEEFKNIVNNFLDKIQDDKEGIFESMPDLYNDSGEKFKFKSSNNKKTPLYDFIDINKILNIDNNTGIDIIRKAVVIAKTPNNNNYIEMFDNLINTYNLIIDELDIHFPGLVDKVGHNTLSAYNYQSKTIVDESGKILFISDIADVMNYKALSNKKIDVNDPYLVSLLKQLKKEIEWIQNHQFDIENIDSFDFYIIDNSKNKNYDSIYGDLYRIDNRWRIPKYTNITYVEQKKFDKYEKVYSIYVVESDKNINEFIYKLDLDAYIDLNSIMIYHRFAEQKSVYTINPMSTMVFNVNAFTVKDYDYGKSTIDLVDVDISINTLLSARLNKNLTFSDIIKL